MILCEIIGGKENPSEPDLESQSCPFHYKSYQIHPIQIKTISIESFWGVKLVKTTIFTMLIDEKL